MTIEKNDYYNILFKNEWSYTKGVVIMSLLAAALASFGGAWGIVGPFPIWGGKFLSALKVDADSWKIFNGSIAKYKFFNNQGSITNIALIFGALISCLLAAQWKVRTIKNVRQVWAAILGGLLMGIGSRIAPSCNIGAMFSSIAAFSLSGWVYLVCAACGAFVGGKLLLRYFMPPVSHERRAPRKTLSTSQRKRNRTIQITLGAALVITGLVLSAALKNTAPSFGVFLFIGIGIGYAIQRSKFCFTASMRDPFLSGSAAATKALIIALAVYTIGMAGIHISRFGIDLARLPQNLNGNNIGLHLVIGSFLFGIGASIAGCCASGTFIRIGEGYIQAVITFVFFVLGSLPGAWIMQNVIQKIPLLSSGKVIYLPSLLGGIGSAVLLQLFVFLLLWLAADQLEKKKIIGEKL
ncbi:MAG: hypothetical protein Ta2G_13890 [Termitinemataceae bacterium]|nr:MAG: hypothetical protein Ta2G_13890 [Termitinemataceae bacterium]